MELTAELLNEIVSSSAPSPAHADRRQADRYATSAIAHIRPADTTPDTAPTMVLTRDISVRGLSIVHSQDMELGQEFLALLPRANSHPLAINCVVTRKYRLGNDLFVIGAVFKEFVN